MEKSIEIKNLSKSFKDVKAVDNLSFQVKKGEFFAFLGVNGAGKSTTISIICGQLEKDAGTVTVNGRNIENGMNEIRKEIGVVFQSSVMDAPLTVRDNLEMRAALYGITGRRFEERLNELAVLLDFKDLLKRTYGKLSGGQKRKIDVARALFHHPDVLILDEPTTGLDPQTRKLMWQVINDLRQKEGITVFLTTHYMEEVADADYIVILDSGRIVAQGTPLELKNRYTGDFITLYNTSEDDVKRLGKPYRKIRDAYRVAVKDTQDAKSLILRFPETFEDFEITKGKMDDVFLAATGKDPEAV
ncbi:MAG: ABC transporter ATP-binding protein [Christensenellales bacterium]